MKFKTKIAIINKIHKAYKKLGIEKFMSKDFDFDRFLDDFLDDNYPQIITKLQSYASASIAITGTNGKKITTNIFLEILKEAKKTFIANILEENEIFVRKTAYLSIIKDIRRNFKVFKKEIKKDYYVMAFDEDELEKYFNSMKFDCILLNNLFINQKDDLTLEEKRKKIRQALILNSDIDLIINADEPYFYQIDDIKEDSLLNKKRNKFYFGFENIEYAFLEFSQKNDLKICPKCNCPLEYEKRFYSHLGKYSCDCNFRRPKLDVGANVKIFKDYCFMEVNYRNEKYVYRFPFGSLYNAYDALGAVALALYLGLPMKVIAKAFENYNGTKGTDEKLIKDKREIIIRRVTNPTSLTESISYLYKNKNTKVVVIFDDDKKDGIDTSWIWDSNFDALRDFENKIYVSGKRFDDMALKLKYARVNPCLIIMEQNIKNAIKCCFYDLKQGENMLILTIPSKYNKVLEGIRKINV